MRSAEQRLPAFIFPSFPEKGSSLFLGELVVAAAAEHIVLLVIDIETLFDISGFQRASMIGFPNCHRLPS